MDSEKFDKLLVDGECAILEDHLDIEVAEVHGLLCGLIAGGSKNDFGDYLPKVHNLLNSGNPFSAGTKDWIVSFFDFLYEKFRTMETIDLPFEQKLNSPEETVYYFTVWSEAFLIGFGSEFNKEELDEEGKELINEISQFTQIETGDVGSDDEFDDIVVTLIEHLKVCAMILYATYGNRTGEKIEIPEELLSDKKQKDDGELVIRDEGISISDL